MATMKDIARLAKVSTSTVSHVINNNRYVSEEIRAKVMAVVKQLNYQPSALARSLKVKETKTIGMLVTASDNPFFAEIINNVEKYCHQHHYNLILSNTEGDFARLQQNLQTLLQKQVDGLLLMGTNSQLAHQPHINLSCPTVIMDWWHTALNADIIYENSTLGGYLATKSLIDYGHKRIGIITGNLTKSIAANRLAGYKQALQEANIPFYEDLVVESQFDFNGGVQGMRALLQRSNPPTAAFACSDTIALGAYQALWRMGLQVPQDMSIIGYDDITMAQYLSPPLTTIQQPKTDLARLAVETLLQRIKQPSETYRTLMLEPKLIARESVTEPKS